MTKRIAVIGCSFSAYWQGDDVASPNMDITTWSNLLRQNFDVIVDTYAQNGSSVGQVAHHMFYFAYNQNTKYDLVLGNIPPLSRDWGFAWNKKDDVNDFDVTMDMSQWYVKQQLDERLFEFTINSNHYVHSHANGVCQTHQPDGMTDDEMSYISDHVDHIENNFIPNCRKNLQWVEIAREYYGKKYPLIFWHHLENMFNDYYNDVNSDVDWVALGRHNIIHDLPVKPFFKDLFGGQQKGKQKYTKQFTTDGAHFNNFGHEQLLEKYILTDPTISSILLNK